MTMITKEKTKEFIDRAYKCACEHGFHDKELSVEHYLMLVITEISEAVEADRKNLHANLAGFDKCIGLTYEDRFRNYVKDSLEDELADVCIRIYDICGTFKLEIDPSNRLVGCNIDKEISFCELCFNLCKFICRDCYELGGGLFSNLSIIGMERMAELSLAFINLMCDDFGIDLERHIELKIEYNESRPVKHEKNY